MRFTILAILLSTTLAAPAPQVNFNDLLSELNGGSAAAGPGGQTSNSDNPLADLIANGPAFIGSLASEMFGTAIPIATAAPVAGAGNNAAVGNDRAAVTEVATFVTMTITVGQGAAPTGGPPAGSGNGGNGGNGGNFGTGTAPSPPASTTAAPSVPITSAASSAVSSAAETSSAAASTPASASPSVGETAIPTRSFDSVATFVN